MLPYEQIAPRGVAVSRDRSRAVFGQAMGLVALTVGFAALAYIGRNVQSSFVIFLPRADLHSRLYDRTL